MKFVKILLILAVIIVAGGYFALNTGPKVDTAWAADDYSRGLEKTGVTLVGEEHLGLEALATGKVSFKGKHQVDQSFSSEELSAMASLGNDKLGLTHDVKVKLGDNNQGEVSFKLSDRFTTFLEESNILASNERLPSFQKFVLGVIRSNPLTETVVNYLSGIANNKPIYAQGSLTKNSANTININITSLKVGQVPMTDEVIRVVEQETVKFVNTVITSSNGFHIEELRVEDGKLYYKGSLPTELEGTKLD